MRSSARYPRRAASAAWIPSVAASPAWYSRATLVLAAAISPPIDLADRAIAWAICAASRPKERPGGDAPAKSPTQAAVKAAVAEAGGDRLADAPRRLVAENDRRQHLGAA